MVTPVCLRLGHCRRPPGDAQKGLPVRAHAQCDCAQGTCGRSFGCEWRLSAHGCGPGLSARLVPVHLCRVVTAPPVLWVSRTLGDRAHAGRTGPALCWSETGGLSRPRVWSQGSLVSGDVGPYCRSGCPTVPLAHQPPDPPSSVRTAPPSWPDAPATGAALAWGPLRDGHRRPRRGPRSPLGGRSTDGSGPCLPLAPVATAAPERPAEGSRASGSESVSWDESGAMDLALGGP